MTNSIDKLLRKAQKHTNANQLDQAKEIYHSILSRFPKNKRALREYEKLQTPPQAILDKLIRLFYKSKFEETITFGLELCERFPQAPILFEILGAASLQIENNTEALGFYNKLLQLQPKNSEALNNIGTVCYNLDQYEKAIHYYQKSIYFEPNAADAHYNLGNSWRKINQPKEACESFKMSLKINPDDPDVLINLGHALRDYGAFSEAIKYYETAIKINPSKDNLTTEIENVTEKKHNTETLIDSLLENAGIEKSSNSAEAFFMKALAYDETNYYHTALDFYKRALEVDPNHHLSHLKIGEANSKNCNYKAAIISLEKSIEINPNYMEAHYALGKAQMEEGHLKAALKSCMAAIEIGPASDDVFELMALIKLKQDDLDAALAGFEKALAVNPNRHSAENNKGFAYYLKGDLFASIKSHKQALKIDPEESIYHQNLASMLRHSGDIRSALEYFDRALKINPSYIKAHWNQAIAYLSIQDFQNGWNKYEWRWAAKQDLVYLETYKKVWNGSRNKRVLVWAEQGVGDEIMFSSIIQEVHFLCAKLIVKIDKRLIPLFSRSFPNDIKFIPRDETVAENEYDCHIPMGSLPQLFRQNAKDFRTASKGWLTADKFKAKNLRRKLLKDGSERIIGISWHSTIPKNSAETKVVSLSKLAKKLNGPKVKLVNLQYGNMNNELLELRKKTDINVTQLHEVDNRDDIDGLASLIMACDRVVSISNSTLHLAGALGKHSDALLAFSPDWRWGVLSDKSYWYDSVRLRRQTKLNDWDTSLEQL